MAIFRCTFISVFACFLALNIIPHVSAQDGDPAVKSKQDRHLMEKEVLGLRIWMIIGIVATALTIVVVVLCCIFDCRIPRTKAEIEAEHENAKLIKQYKNTIERLPKGKKIKVIKALPTSALPGIGFAQSRTSEAQAGTSTEMINGADSTPLAQHPSTLLTGGNEHHLQKALGSTTLRPGLVATVRTLASIQHLHKSAQQKLKRSEVIQEQA